MPSQLDERDTRAGALEEVLKVLDRLPIVSSVKKDVTSLRELLYQRRAPRLVALGRHGAGRSRLANALLWKDALPEEREPGRWVRVDAQGSLLDWLTVEVGDGGAAEALRGALDESEADVTLIVAAAPELDRGLADFLRDARALLEQVERPPVTMAVLTRIDELPPGDAKAPYPQDKSHTVDLSLQRFRRALAEAGFEVAQVHAVSWKDATGLAELSEGILAQVPERAKVEGGRALFHATRGRREVANRIVHCASTLALTVGMAPVPFSDAFVIAPLQVAMVSAVAHLGGRPWDRRTMTEWVASMGAVGTAGMGLRWTARQLLKLVPGAGTLVSAGVAGAGTVSLGQGAIAYFLREDARRRLAQG